jgi:hypothetical protein
VNFLGPTSAPRVFTKIVSVVAAILRAQSIRVAIYLDDWLVVNQNKQHLILDRGKMSHHFEMSFLEIPGVSNLLQVSFFRSSSEPEKMYCKKT